MLKFVPRSSLSIRQLKFCAVLVTLAALVLTFHQISDNSISEEKRKAINAVLYHSRQAMTRVQCQPCVEGVVYDLTGARNLTDLDGAIAPIGSTDNTSFSTSFDGARIRLLGVAEQDRKSTCLKLENGERVRIVGFQFDEQLLNRKVIVEGCVSRYWNPTWQQRRDAISQLPARERVLYNTVTAHSPGLNYVVNPDLVKLW